MRAKLCVVAVLTVAFTFALPVAAVRAQASRSIDEELLEDLGADPLDQLDRELFEPDRKPQRPQPDRGEDAQEKLRRELGPAGVSEEANPVLDIARRMRDVKGRIDGNDSGPATQAAQKRIVADLDKLIQQARKKSQAAGKPGSSDRQKITSRAPIGQPRPKPGGGGTKPSERPAAESNRRPGSGDPTRRPDMAEMQELMKQLWGELPPHAKEQMLQSPPEEFLPRYELLIEKYFRRLSEEE